MPEPVTAALGCYSFSSAAGSAGAASALGPIGVAVAVATVLGQVNKALQTAKRNRTLAKHNQMIRQHDFETKTLELKQQQLTSQLKSMMGVEDIMDFELSDMMQTDPDFIYQDVDIYTIQAGDTLSGIAQNHGTDWQKLFRVNQFSSNIYDPNKILPGQTIIVPKVQRPTTTQRKSLLNPKIINPKITDSSKVVKSKDYGYRWGTPQNTTMSTISSDEYKFHEVINVSKVVEKDKYLLGIKKGDIAYSTNCGWIDLTHAFETSPRKNVGADNLWKQILNETGKKSITDDGFYVEYRQDASIKNWLPNIGITKKYFVKYGLTVQEKESIALAIFQEVSMEFEDFQKVGVLIGRGDSSFEPADLVSNLIGFYHHVKNISKSEIYKIISKLNIQQSLEIYKQYPGTFHKEEYKNRKFTPRFFPNKYSKNPVFPSLFQTIQPAIKGNNYRDWEDYKDDGVNNYRTYP